ncbi:MAG: hypothetical protein LBU27_06165 [Candidatus Peribacteria bacterium]|jgi:hypothetical protein|nr:hypothetical protein [Candidatus Peribacteria bacterium]
MYSTREKIRDEAGFTNNPNITQTRVEEQQSIAYSEVHSIVSTLYDTTQFVDNNVKFKNSTAQSYLESCERLLAASYLLMKQYEVNSMGGTLEQARNLRDEANAKLNKIASGTARLFDTKGKEFRRIGQAVS